ncbi:hypothetical protein VPH35_122257 [Triticum aestivum]
MYDHTHTHVLLGFGVKGEERERALAVEVARGVVVAGDEDAPVPGADHARAADAGRLAPHHLRVVPAHLAGVAGVAVKMVVLLLVHPQLHRVGGRPRLPGTPEDVLAERPAGVLEPAIAGALRRPVLRKPGHVVVPRHRADTVHGAGAVVQVDEVLRGVLRRDVSHHGHDYGQCEHCKTALGRCHD